MTISEMPRNKAKNPTQISSNAPCTDRYCWEAQKPSRISTIPASRPSHQALLTSLASMEVKMSSVPRKMSSRPRIEASVQNASKGLANDQAEPNRKIMPITTCSQRQLEWIEAIMNSLIMLNKNRTPSKTPTVAIEAGLNRKAIHPMISHAMPVSRNSHQGPASRHSPARVRDPMVVRSSMVLMSHDYPFGLPSTPAFGAGPSAVADNPDDENPGQY